MIGEGWGLRELTTHVQDSWGLSRAQARLYVKDAHVEFVNDYEVEDSGPNELWAQKLLFHLALTYKAIFELNMNTMSETFTTLYGSDEKASTDECMFISLPENSKIEWKE